MHYFSLETLPFSFSPPFILLRRVQLQFGLVDLKGRNRATEKYSIGWILLLLAGAAISPIPLLQDRGPAPSLHGPNGAFYTAPTSPQIGSHLHRACKDLWILPPISLLSHTPTSALKSSIMKTEFLIMQIYEASNLAACPLKHFQNPSLALSVNIKFICPVNTLSQQ